ncbi:MAG: hypothetical protein IPL23_20050 [Saprospiraceae bacterium]|nr:hypothetical protein [Saprospiraceae bacterium]
MSCGRNTCSTIPAGSNACGAMEFNGEFNVLRKQCLQPVPAFARGRNGQLAIGFASNGQCPAGAMMKFKKKLTAEN